MFPLLLTLRSIKMLRYKTDTNRANKTNNKYMTLNDSSIGIKQLNKCITELGRWQMYM